MKRLVWLPQNFSLAGRSGRVLAAWIMLIAGFGRVGLYLAVALPTDECYVQINGALLIIGGLAVMLTTPWRLRRSGRIVAAAAAVILAGMAWDIHVISISFFMLVLPAISLACESMTSRVDC